MELELSEISFLKLQFHYYAFPHFFFPSSYNTRVSLIPVHDNQSDMGLEPISSHFSQNLWIISSAPISSVPGLKKKQKTKNIFLYFLPRNYPISFPAPYKKNQKTKNTPQLFKHVSISIALIQTTPLKLLMPRSLMSLSLNPVDYFSSFLGNTTEAFHSMPTPVILIFCRDRFTTPTCCFINEHFHFSKYFIST